MPDEAAIFKCVVIAPSGRLLDVVTESVIIPAHDGLRGVLKDHIPMFCQLGLGIMEVKADNPQSPTTYLLIDGGFALFAQNLLTVIAYEAVIVKDLTDEQIEKLLQKAQKHLTQKGIDPKQYKHEFSKTKYLEELINLQKAAAADL
jgi:ATP synthase F1 epsilon subunit